MASERPAIIIMAKAPHAGKAKSRLRSALSDDDTETLAAAFFADTVRLARQSDIEIIIAFAPDDSREELEQLVDKATRLLWLRQRGGDLGERLESAAFDAEALGFGPVVFLGTDSPNQPAANIRAAVASLTNDEADIVLGPASDGGCYLIGIGRREKGLFDAIDWSSDRVYAQIAANAERLRLAVRTLPEWYDVDTPDDLARLRRDLAIDPDAAPATAACAKSWPWPALRAKE